MCLNPATLSSVNCNISYVYIYESFFIPLFAVKIAGWVLG